MANQLHPEARTIDEGTDLYGRAFEHFILNEVRAWIEYEQRRSLVVSRAKERRVLDDGIEILPWRVFCEELWGGGFNLDS